MHEDAVEINFNPAGDVFNVFTKAILTNDLSSDLLKHDEIGNELYFEFHKKTHKWKFISMETNEKM